jgi:hypothetical protein
MHIPQLLHPLARAPDIEIVETALPDPLFFLWPQFSLPRFSFFLSQHPSGKLLDRFAGRRVLFVVLSFRAEPLGTLQVCAQKSAMVGSA